MVVTFVTSGTPSHLYCAIESLSAFQKKKKRKQALPSTVFHMTTLKKRIRNVSLREQIKTCRQTRLHIKVRKGGGGKSITALSYTFTPTEAAGGEQLVCNAHSAAT